MHTSLNGESGILLEYIAGSLDSRLDEHRSEAEAQT